MLDRSILSEKYFTRQKIVQHHVDSFNDFLEYGMQQVVDELGTIDTDIGKTGEEGVPTERVHVKLGKLRVGTPVVKEADGAVDTLYPNDARLRNVSYAASMYLEMSIVRTTDEGVTEDEAVEVEIGSLPIMLMSNACNMHDLSADELAEFGEDPMDPGGYFIINGTERVIMTLEDLVPNKILTEFGERYGDPIQVAKVFSERQGYRALVVVERGRNSLLEVSFPSSSGRLNFITLLRALGLDSDEDIANAISSDPEIMPFIYENLEAVEVFKSGPREGEPIITHEDAMEAIGKKVATGQTDEYRDKRASYVLDRYLLPHLWNHESTRLLKAHYLARMAEACFELVLNKRGQDDKDHYANKRLKLSGHLMEDLFRVSFNRLAKDFKYQLERSHMRNRDLNVKTAVRVDVLTQRLLQPLATGNWVGGRSGVAQLLDRIDFISSLSHLRRVISPLSRTQPHFEARDLHATQWGRLCPSETPEGPNCGLVKNFAQLVELSVGEINVDSTRDVLLDSGVKPAVDPTLYASHLHDPLKQEFTVEGDDNE